MTLIARIVLGYSLVWALYTVPYAPLPRTYSHKELKYVDKIELILDVILPALNEEVFFNDDVHNLIFWDHLNQLNNGLIVYCMKLYVENKASIIR